MTSTHTGIPSNMFPPTTDPVVTEWHEVAASFDSRDTLPRCMAVCAVDDLGAAQPFLTSTCVEIQLPGGAVMPLDFVAMRNVQLIDFPVKWRVNKPETLSPVTFVVFGTGMSTQVNDSVVVRDEEAAA
jgi:hypothetical protein